MSDFLAASGNQLSTVYTPAESRGVIALILASFISLFAVVATGILLAYKRYRSHPLFPNTHVATFYTSLLLSNFIQSIGSSLSISWVSSGGVYPGFTCSTQGGWKNAGNLSTSFFSALIALHLFFVLFRRSSNSRRVKWASVALVWSSVGIIVFFGPVVLEAGEGKAPYFGPSGLWCWITRDYKAAQTGAEYVFMFTSAALSFILYTLIFLRMRGNLASHPLRLIWIPRSSAWKLDLGRDEVDRAMFGVVKAMIWYPVAYTFLILPIALVRFTAWFSGDHVPLWATILADFIFNLTGFVNCLLLFITQRLLPRHVPTLATRRKTLDLSTAKGLGVDPFILPPLETESDKLSISTVSTDLEGKWSPSDSESSKTSMRFDIPRKPPGLRINTKLANERWPPRKR